MSGKLIVETERLWLREFVPEDAAAAFELGSNPEVPVSNGIRSFASMTVVWSRPGHVIRTDSSRGARMTTMAGSLNAIVVGESSAETGKQATENYCSKVRRGKIFFPRLDLIEANAH